MTLKQLNYFVTACRHENISHAADEFSVSQPSISSAIKNLEKEFGVTLIQRRQTGFALTEDGEALRQLAESLLNHAEGVAAAMNVRAGDRKPIRLGMPPMTGAILFPKLYIDLPRTNPDIQLFVREDGQENLAKMLEDDIIDAAFLPKTESISNDCRIIPIMTAETVCCVSSTHRLTSLSHITPPDLAGVPLALFPRGYYQTERIYSMFEAAGIAPNVIHMSNQLSTIETLIESGIAVGFFLRPIVQKNSKITAIPLDPPLYSNISLVLKKRSCENPDVRRFTEQIRISLAETL